MTGRTHFVVGETAALLLTHPNNWKELTLCLGAAAIGASICDIDVSTSKSHQSLKRILLVTAIVAAMVLGMEYFGHIGIIPFLQSRVVLWQALLGGGLFLAVCFVGMHCPHRTFMHSVPGWLLLCGILQWAAPPLVAGFSIAMLSHILLDLFNYKAVHLLYPLDWRFSLDLCPADGKVDHLIFRVGSLLWPVAFIWQAMQML